MWLVDVCDSDLRSMSVGVGVSVRVGVSLLCAWRDYAVVLGGRSVGRSGVGGVGVGLLFLRDAG